MPVIACGAMIAGTARTARAEAGYFVREFVPDGSLAVVHIYFPDPWPKKRHQKRRLIQARVFVAGSADSQAAVAGCRS